MAAQNQQGPGAEGSPGQVVNGIELKLCDHDLGIGGVVDPDIAESSHGRRRKRAPNPREVGPAGSATVEVVGAALRSQEREFVDGIGGEEAGKVVAEKSSIACWNAPSICRGVRGIVRLSSACGWLTNRRVKPGLESWCPCSVPGSVDGIELLMEFIDGGAAPRLAQVRVLAGRTGRGKHRQEPPAGPGSGPSTRLGRRYCRTVRSREHRTAGWVRRAGEREVGDVLSRVPRGQLEALGASERRPGKDISRVVRQDGGDTVLRPPQHRRDHWRAAGVT
jgi:hypothetical protein